MTIESRKKMSESHKGLLSGKKHPSWGKKRSLESRRKMSIAKKGHPPYGGEFKKGHKINLGRKRKPFSEETKRKMSETHKRIGTKFPINHNKGENSGAWKGGKPKCIICKKVINYHKIFCFEHKQSKPKKTLEEIRKRHQDYFKNRKRIDINFRLACNLRGRLNNTLKRNSKSGSAVRDLGCSINELRFYLEGMFKPEMTWENYGLWHIDHIIPLSFFDLTDREQLLKACHYTNLQPLWAGDNRKKGAKLLTTSLF